MNTGIDQPASERQATAEELAGGPERLWAPWRMRYVGGGHAEAGCIFCNRLAETDDGQSLILHRDELAFIIMNLYPYTTGHTMIVPVAHIPSPELANSETLAAMSTLQAPLLRGVRRALSCHGFNLGTNVGAVAGAGVAEHLHEHVVPRWSGDANFMPIVGNTVVMPELIPVTYAKLRAELVRELFGASHAGCVVSASGGQIVLVNGAGDGPQTPVLPDVPIWLSATRAISALCGSEAELIGWSDAGRAVGSGIHLEFRIAATAQPGPLGSADWRWVARSEPPGSGDMPDPVNPEATPQDAPEPER
jgi:ATP adenylyltransferase